MIFSVYGGNLRGVVFYHGGSHKLLQLEVTPFCLSSLSNGGEVTMRGERGIV